MTNYDTPFNHAIQDVTFESNNETRDFTSEVILNLLTCLITAIIGWLVFIFYFVLEKRREKLKLRSSRKNSFSYRPGETINETIEM